MYVSVTTGDVPASKLNKAIKTGKLSLTKSELSGSGFTTKMHPMNAKLIKKAQKSNKGVNLSVAKGEVLSNFEDMNGGALGGSIWSKIWKGIKSAWNPIIKPALSAALDAGVGPLTSAIASSPYAGLAPFVGPVRGKIRSLTGVGLKGSESAKDRMAKVRAAKKNKKSSNGKVNVLTAGSFLIN